MFQQSLVWHHWFWYFINFSFDKMIFSIFQVSRDGKRWLTASVQHFILCGILLERLSSLKQWEFYSCTCKRPQYSRKNLTGFAVALLVTCLETASIEFNDSSVCNVKKLHFQANLCEIFAEDKKHYCGYLVLGGQFYKRLSSTISKQISVRTLEKCTWLYIDL